MKILVTGGAGFIGSNLADRLLSLGHEVIVVDNFNSYYDPAIKRNNVKNNLNNQNYHLYECDIQDYASMTNVFKNNNIDVVVHLAASAGVRPSIENPVFYADNNIKGTLNILECMKHFGVKKMVFASSSSVYGNCEAAKFSEDLDLRCPISPYAASKLSCEHFIYTYHHLYGIKACCLRFFTVYGPRQRTDLAISKFVRYIKENKSIELFGDGSTCRDYTYISDITDGIIASINYDKTPYEIINLGSSNPIKLIDMVNTIEKVLNKKAEIIYKGMQLGDVDRTYADTSKAEKLLNYSPKVTFEEGIRNFVKWLYD